MHHPEKKSDRNSLRRWFDLSVTRRAGKVAIVVGTALNLINHYGVLIGESVLAGVAAQMVLTYVVPYFVSTHGQVTSNVRR